NITSISRAGPDAGHFSNSQAGLATLDEVGTTTTTFTVTFQPTSTGSKTASISVVSNDADENPYVINLTGNGIAPEIHLQEASGPTDILAGGSFDFGEIEVGDSSGNVTFSIQNTA